MKLKIDFTQTIETYHYYVYADVVSYLGGIKSAIMPVFGLVLPLVVLNFLYGLSPIIQETYTIKYCDELKSSIDFLSKMLS